MEGSGIDKLRRVVEELEGEVDEIKTALRGGGFGQSGLVTRMESIETEQRHLERIMEGIEESEKRREAEAARREKNRERFQNRVYSLFATTLTGIMVSLVAYYLTTGFGGG